MKSCPVRIHPVSMAGLECHAEKARMQENYFLSIPHERVRELLWRVQALLGYSIHPPFMGHANGLYPRRALER
jgi:hypothetical protein